MKVIETRFLRGPNLFHTKPCFQFVIDLEELDDRPSTDFPGFTDRLLAAIPSLMTHRCSRGHEGGFVERLREGTYMAHIVEHVLLELQCLAGTEVGYGRARMIPGRPRLYRVVTAYRLEGVVEAALPAAIRTVEALCRGEPVDLTAAIEGLREVAADTKLGPSTQAIVDAARRRGVPVTRITEESSLIQLGWGRHQKRIQATVTSNTSHIAVEIASDKDLTKLLLLEAGVPVPRGEVVQTAERAVAVARRLGAAVVVKPLDANQGKGVSTGLMTPDEVRAAFERARRYRSRIIVERHLEGSDHRVIVVNGQVLAVARRSPPLVTGDGKRNVLELVQAENRNPARGEGHGNVLTRIPIDETTHEVLARQGLSLDSVPPAGMAVVLRGNANLSTGGTAEDVTHVTHPEVAMACVRAARQIGLDVAGIDVICRDISRPLEEQGGGIVEVNAAPGIRMHEHPTRGERHPVGEAILETLFPEGDGRIPLVAVTGTNGKTTTTLLIAHAMQAAGLVTGVATTEGICIGDQKVRKGDCTGFWSARTVLTSPEVEAAVLETARGGILKRGLGFDRCDVAVVTNISDDHLGQDYVETVEDIARVKAVVAEAAAKAVVLNADDPHCVGMAARLDKSVRIFYFSMQGEEQHVMARHLDRGGSGVYVANGMVMLAVDEHRIPLVEVTRIGFTLQGRAVFNVANSLAATAALWACGFDRARIVNALTTFRSSVDRNPLRLNAFTARGVHILLDYAHNAASYRALIETARRLDCNRLVGVVTAPGDRRDEKLREVGAICGRGFDELVVYEMDDARGRAPGATMARIREGAIDDGGSDPHRVAAIGDVREAVRHGFDRCEPGDLLVIGCASDLDDLLAAVPDAEEVTDLLHAPPAEPQGLPAWMSGTRLPSGEQLNRRHH